MKSGIMKKWLPKERARKLTEKNTADAKLIQDTLTNGAAREAELPAIAARWRAATTDVMKKAIAAEYSAKLSQIAEAYLAYFNSRSGSERRRIAKELGINRFRAADGRPGLHDLERRGGRARRRVDLELPLVRRGHAER
jgi:hypothetical protein